MDPVELTVKAREAIERADRIAVSSISVWEIGLKVKRGRLEIPLSMNDYVQRLGQLDRLEILPVDVQAWLDNLELPWEHRDPADRTIVALAKRLGCALITSDQVIAGYYPQTIW